MARLTKRLTTRGAAKKRAPGYHADGEGLYLQVTGTGARSWIFRYRLHGRLRDMGLGPLADISVDQARQFAKDARELVRRAAMRPTQGRWQVMGVEDADRLTEQAADALLKSIEEPAPRTVWVLCAPTVEDVVPTIRSRCRLLVLRTPPVGAVAEEGEVGVLLQVSGILETRVHRLPQQFHGAVGVHLFFIRDLSDGH